MQIQVLGPLQAWRDGAEVDLGPTGQRAVFGLLVLAGGQPVTVAELLDALWPARPPSTAVNILQTYVSRLRRLLELDRRPHGRSVVLPLTNGGYALRLADEQVDLSQFRSLVGRAERFRAAGDAPAAIDLLSRALRLWRGTPLAGVTVLAGHPKVVALGEERSAAVARYAETTIMAGAAADALPILSEAAAAQPLDEAAQARLIRAYHAAGHRAAALEHFQQTHRRLADELGVNPGPVLRAAHAALLTEPARAPGNGNGPAGRQAAVPTPPEPPAAPPAIVPAQVPADVPGFVGRADHLARLDALLAGAQTGAAPAVVITAVSGTAGVGKTALAIHWAHRVADRFPDGQLYLNLRGFDPAGPPMDPAVAIRAFLDAFAVPPARMPSTLDGQVALYRSLLAGKRMLVLLDNARDAEQVRPLLPGSATAVVVVTSRSPLVPLAASNGARVLTLGLLPGAEARELLAARLGPDRLAAEPAATDEVVARCVGLPLALTVVAAQAAARPEFRLTDLAAALAASGGPLDALTAGDPVTDSRAVFSWSYAAVRPPAARLFRLLGLHRGPDISAAAAASLAGVAPAAVRPLLAELTEASLLTEYRSGRYGCHDLLRAYAADLAAGTDPAGEREAAVGRLLDHYLHTAHACAFLLDPARDPIALRDARPGVTAEPLVSYEQAAAWFAAEQHTLLAALQQAAQAGADTHTWQLAWAVLTFLDRRGHWPELVATQQAALRAAERLGDRAEQARAHRGLARAHGRQGRYDEALAHITRANDLYQELGSKRGQTRTELNLATLHGQVGSWPAALAHARRADALARQTGELASRAMALNSVGWCHAQLGEYRRALAFCEQALALHQQLDDRRSQAAVWDSLGFVHHQLGDHARAAACYDEALGLLRDLDDRTGMAETLIRQGDAHRTRDPAVARACWQQAVDILSELRHPAVAGLRARLRDLDPAPAAHGSGQVGRDNSDMDAP